MKTLSQLVSEAHGAEQPEYLKHTLMGREEIGRFAAALREQVIAECIAALHADGDHAGAVHLGKVLLKGQS